MKKTQAPRKTEAQRKVTHTQKYGSSSKLPSRQYKNRK